jgi:hypothetical protein
MHAGEPALTPDGRAPTKAQHCLGFDDRGGIDVGPDVHPHASSGEEFQSGKSPIVSFLGLVGWLGALTDDQRVVLDAGRVGRVGVNEPVLHGVVN